MAGDISRREFTRLPATSQCQRADRPGQRPHPERKDQRLPNA